jgi:hypothetical protein
MATIVNQRKAGSCTADLKSVAELLKNSGMEVTTEHSNDHIHLYAQQGAEDFEAEFAYKPAEFSQFDEYTAEDVKQYYEWWGDKVIYKGYPGVVKLYETMFGVSSAADVQTVNDANMSQAKSKSVASVEELFKGAGYIVSLDVSDKNTPMEFWTITCLLPTTGSTFVAGFHYDADTADLVGSAQLAVAQMQNLTLKTDGCWFYYGVADAIELFESLGVTSPVVLNEPSTADVDPKIAAIEAKFQAEGCMVTLTNMPETMLTIIKPGVGMAMAGTGGADWVATMSETYKASAEAQGFEMQIKGDWFYYGHADIVPTLEGLI